jgi:hypothetical protein
MRTKNKTLKLTPSDYKNILKFYKIDTSALSTKDIKTKAEHYLVMKLCKCIKNITHKSTHNKSTHTVAKDEKRAIALCYNSVLRKKNVKVFKFQCKKSVKLFPKKGTRKIFVEKLGA